MKRQSDLVKRLLLLLMLFNTGSHRREGKGRLLFLMMRMMRAESANRDG